MGRGTYEEQMRLRLHDLEFQIACIRARLSESADDRLRIDLAGRLALLEEREGVVRHKLDALPGQHDARWEELRLEIEEDWDALMQDFEERLASLA